MDIFKQLYDAVDDKIAIEKVIKRLRIKSKYIALLKRCEKGEK